MSSESGQPLCDQLPDPAEADDTHCLTEDLRPENDERFHVRSRSVASAGDLPRRRQHQRDRVLGSAVDVRRRGVDHQDSGGGGSVDIDVVQTDTGARDDLQLRGGGNDLRVDRGRRAHQEGIGFRSAASSFFPVRSIHPAHLDGVAESGNGRLGVCRRSIQQASSRRSA